MLSFSNTEKDDKNLVECMEQIHALHIDELDPLLFELSAMHLDKVAIGDWAASIREMTKDTDLITPDRVDNVAQFLQQYVHEHYLNKNQVDHDHTQHVPFSKELTESLRSVWGLKGDVRKNPIIQTGEKLRAVDKGKVLDKKIPVTFVPVKGLMRIFAGDIGDACYTSRYDELASGQHEGITAVLMVTNRGKAEERMEGSMLLIETTQIKIDTTNPALVVRANNPRENLLGKVDPDGLVEASLEYARATAKERDINMVGVVHDHASAASSNRSHVAEYYQKHFSAERPLTLVNTEETNFNGYNIWNSAAHPVVRI